MRAIFVWTTLTAVCACAPDDIARPAAQRSTSRPADDDGGTAPACIDADGDGFGSYCDRGPDCDDADPTQGETCDPCRVPAEGCACADTRPVECDADTNGPVTTDTCWTGQRSCEGARWSRCVPYRRRFE